MDWTDVTRATKDDFLRTYGQLYSLNQRLSEILETSEDPIESWKPHAAEYYTLLEENVMLLEQIEEEKTWTPFQRQMRDLRYIAEQLPESGTIAEKVIDEKDIIDFISEIVNLSSEIEEGIKHVKNSSKGSNLYQKQIKKLRTDMGYSRRKFSDALGIPKVTLYRWEAGLNNPRTKNLVKMYNLAKEYGHNFNILPEEI